MSDADEWKVEGVTELREDCEFISDLLRAIKIVLDVIDLAPKQRSVDAALVRIERLHARLSPTGSE